MFFTSVELLDVKGPVPPPADDIVAAAEDVMDVIALMLEVEIEVTLEVVLFSFDIPNEDIDV